ncbi:MAG: Rieske (2Fe-2S) protein [Phycisphaerales bacterium]|nr:Rieske (2Fe-2S) protein [Phycisphaerales bacterium]
MSDGNKFTCPIEQSEAQASRRGFVSTLVMLAGLLAGYGLGAYHFFRYLIPLRRKDSKREMFVGVLEDLPVGSSLTVKDLRGEEIAIARVSENSADPAKGFKALSSTCPHLGCRVHWEGENQRFFCPCHNGVFDKNGIAQSGPPAKENKNLATFDVKVSKETGRVYVMVTEPKRYGV